MYLEHVETDRKGNECFSFSVIDRVLCYNNVLKDHENAPYIVVREAYQLKVLDEVQVVEIGPEVAHELTLLEHKVDEDDDEEEMQSELQDNSNEVHPEESLPVEYNSLLI